MTTMPTGTVLAFRISPSPKRASPELGVGRLEVGSDGQIVWSLPKPWRDGREAFLMPSLQFIERLVALVVHPREHQLTYHGILAPAAPLRDQVGPRPVKKREPIESRCPEPEPESRKQVWIPWSQLLQRVFGADALRCPRCQRRRHMISEITDQETVRKVLEGVRAATRRSSGSSGGGDPSTQGSSRLRDVADLSDHANCVRLLLVTELPS